MVSVSLRQNPSSATDQNAPALVSTAAAIAAAATASASVRPVSGTPAWARDDHAADAPRPASPWDEWTIPPKPALLTDTDEFAVPEPPLSAPTATVVRGTAAVRKPSPHPAEPPQSSPVPASPAPALSPDFRPWRIDFAQSDVVEYPEAPQPESPTITKRLLLLFGLAYLFIAALASGLAYTGYLTATASTGGGEGHGPDDDTDPARKDRPDAPLPHPRPPSRHPDAPGLHTRPDGSRYLVMPLPADLADRFRAHTAAAPAMGAMGAPVVIGGGAL